MLTLHSPPSSSRTPSWSVPISTTMTATSPTAPSAVEAGKCWCVATTTAVGQSCTVLHRCSGYGSLDKGLLICNIHIHFVFVCEGVSAWSVWISWSAPARRRRPSKKTRGTATCADLETPTGYCGDGTTGPAGCSTSSPTTMSRNLWVGSFFSSSYDGTDHR